MTTINDGGPDLAAIIADREAGTPGPWDWEVNRMSKNVQLCGGRGASDLTVMSFQRYGMSGAAPVFWFWKGNVSDEPKRADALAIPASGRDHHFDWFARLDHPDARRIARVPELEQAVIDLTAEVARLDQENAIFAAGACDKLVMDDWGHTRCAGDIYKAQIADLTAKVRQLETQIVALTAERDMLRASIPAMLAAERERCASAKVNNIWCPLGMSNDYNRGFQAGGIAAYIKFQRTIRALGDQK